MKNHRDEVSWSTQRLGTSTPASAPRHGPHLKIGDGAGHSRRYGDTRAVPVPRSAAASALLVLFPPDDTASNLDPGNPAAPGFPQVAHGSIKLGTLFNDPSDRE